MNSCAKNGGAPRRRFPAIGEKPEGGVQTPPGPARVKHVHDVRTEKPYFMEFSIKLTMTNDSSHISGLDEEG